MNAFTCKFGELEAILADLNEIPSASRTAFQARLKNYHRLGFPKGIGGGRGRAVIYGVGDLIQMALAVEMTQLGLTPERAITVMTSDEYPMLMAVQAAASSLIGADEDTFHPEAVLEDAETDPLSMFLYFDPAALSPHTDHDVEDWASATFFYAGEGVLRENLTLWTTRRTRRLSVINVTALLWQMSAWIEQEERDSFFEQIASWANWLITRADFDLDEWLCGPVRRAMVDQAANPISPRDPLPDDRRDWPLDAWTPLPELIQRQFPDGAPAISDGEDKPPHLFDMLDQGGAAAVPDMVINLPGQRQLFVDAKVIPAVDIPADIIRTRVQELVEQPYSGQFTDRTKYTILYLPGVRFFTDAHREDKRLWEWAFEQKVIIATPENMVTILKAAETAWEAAATWDQATEENRAHTLTEGVMREQERRTRAAIRRQAVRMEAQIEQERQDGDGN